MDNNSRVPSRAMVKARAASLQRESTEDQHLEVTKALRLAYAPVPDLTIHFRRLAKHTIVGSADDREQIEALRTEATEMAAAIKQTVPTVTWDWLCKILSDEYTRAVAESEHNLERNRRYFGGTDKVPNVVKERLKK
jgi:hypothetical protein